MPEITRHFTATTFVVCQDKVLLHLHKKLGIWLPAGGHIDRDELPEEAARREVREETGLDVNLYQPEQLHDFGDDEAIELHRPVHLLLENINPFHQHIDFIYYARTDTFDLMPGSGETQNLRWFQRHEISDTDLPMPGNVKALALEALDTLAP